ncbi:MAG: flagellar biosynthesis anti-sigma factor FlgM [Rhodocyclales bacterium GT-UBC]|nr:MAG: flagellar biosynthesis anti-sigma factor FlgM [Rhodocyclales bacterium GT-UBC]
MKIDNSYKPTTAQLAPRQSVSPSSSSNESQEAVSLSSLAGSLKSNDAPPVNSARIQEIKQAISEGRFQINADAIADRLIESARDLVSSKNQREA